TDPMYLPIQSASACVCTANTRPVAQLSQHQDGTPSTIANIESGMSSSSDLTATGGGVGKMADPPPPEANDGTAQTLLKSPMCHCSRGVTKSTARPARRHSAAKRAQPSSAQFAMSAAN